MIRARKNTFEDIIILLISRQISENMYSGRLPVLKKERLPNDYFQIMNHGRGNGDEDFESALLMRQTQQKSGSIF